ncbi:MAG: isoprenyl transferase [Bacteroidaceae bacterium]|nr:isoprenyl transferase [Bacteroidaceae bacterium]
MNSSIQIDPERIPQHVAIIMDGNGRWAKQRGLHRNVGHQQGVETVKRITELSTRIGIKFLTLYTFSTENWSRPSDEVAALMSLVLDSLEEEIFMRNNVRFRMIGDAERLPKAVRDRIRQCEERTSGNTKMTMVIAMSYSSRWEIANAAREIAAQAVSGELTPAEITEQTICDHLTTAFMPDPDLLIRTGGELRLSNYLLWQCAYSELYFCDTFWPDFTEDEMLKAISDYQQRERRYGKTSEQVANEEDKEQNK